MTGVLYAATLVSALGCGLIAGVFFAFSSFIMPALKRLPPAHGIAAMQSINKLRHVRYSHTVASQLALRS